MSTLTHRSAVPVEAVTRADPLVVAQLCSLSLELGPRSRTSGLGRAAGVVVNLSRFGTEVGPGPAVGHRSIRPMRRPVGQTCPQPHGDSHQKAGRIRRTSAVVRLMQFGSVHPVDLRDGVPRPLGQ